MIAYLAFAIWSVVVLILFKRVGPAAGLSWGVIGGFLLLPPQIGINLPFVPNLDKASIPVLAALAAAMLLAPGGAPHRPRPRSQGASAHILPGWLPRNPWVAGLLILFVISIVMTTLTNGDRVIYFGRTQPGMQFYDGMSMLMSTAITILPLVLARKYLGHPETHRTLLAILALAGLAYSIPTLYEVRMSPQINKMVYGFFPHDWRQHVRGGGFRPVVFMSHGLALGIFLSTALIAAMGYMRIMRTERKMFYFIVAAWLLMTLVLAKTLGAFMIALVIVPIVLLTTVRIQMLAGLAISVFVLSYPMLRIADLAPTEQVARLADRIDTQRANSFRFRVDSEDILLDRALERPLFGWGGWGRSRVINERGRDSVVTDGRWVITFGLGGWTRYIAEFGLITLPVILLALRRRRYEIDMATSTLCLVLGAYSIDLIPNGFMSPIMFLVAGALAGRLELQRVPVADSTALAPPDGPRRLVFASTSGSGPAEAVAREGIPYTRQTMHRRRGGIAITDPAPSSRAETGGR